jgi:hypothetical protein
VQLRGDDWEPGRERFGLLDLVVEGERATEVPLRRSLHQRRLERGEPCAADLLGAAFGAQELRGLELGVGDVHAHHLVGGTDSPVDGLRERQSETPAAERAVRIIVHARH